MKPSVLIVEDERTLLDYLHKKFAKEKFNVLLAYDGDRGLELALAHQPDLILLDIIMPKMDGMQMLAKLRQDPWGSTAKVIFLTNIGDMEKKVEAENKGVIAYLVKSELKIDEIVQSVREAIKK